MNNKGIFLWFWISLFPILLSAQKRLAFEDGKFVIAQFTDVHWRQQSPKCAQTAAVIRAVLKSECPDIAVLTGDVVTDHPAVDGWKAIIALFEEAQMPFVVTMGNHDAEFLSKEEIYKLLLQSPYYVGSEGDKQIKGYGNCVLPIYDSGAGEKVKALLYCMDSNDYQSNPLYGPYDWIHFDQLMWYRQQSASFRLENKNEPLPSLAFFHIPLLEYNEIASRKNRFGRARDRGVGASMINSGMFASFLEQKDVMGVFTGHDHNNEYIGINKGIALAYGRVSGMDGYGALKRGARIIQLFEGKFLFDTWIATPSKREAIYHYPSGKVSKRK